MLKEEVLDMKKSVTEMHKNLESESTFALNLLHEVKQSAKRWLFRERFLPAYRCGQFVG